MRAVKISQDFVPVSELKAEAADWLRRIAETDAPVVVTQHGRPAGVLLSPRAYDELTERGRFLASVNQGMAEAVAGRAVAHAEAARRLKARFPGKRR
jgi:prevent-host-death family protein